MSDSNAHRLRQRISRWRGITAKQAVLTLSIAVMLSILAGLAELAVEVRTMREEVQEQTRQLLDLVDGTAAEAAFQLNPDLAQQVANGLFDGGNVKRISLRDDFGRTMAVREQESNAETDWLLNTLFGDILHYQGTLEYDMNGNALAEPVGEIELTLDLDSLGRAFLERSALIMTLSVVKAFAIAALVVLTFYFLITRPLLKVHAAISNVDPQRPGDWPKPWLKHHPNDELGHLVEGLDALLNAFQHGLDQRDRLHQISTVDGLTGIANRRRFDIYLSEEWSRARRSGHDLSILFMDIDSFKAFNDNYGHVAGDDCLRDVARALAGAVPRTTDLAARYGGEEFVCVLPDTDIHGAVAVAHRIHEAVLALEIPHAFADTHDRITVSIGVASASPAQPGTASDSLLEQADRRLYQAKTSGRNRIVWK
ncbi:hypothetical protein L861_20405 [Litchfieldella anticariensis FP35 = DSM 16096]|uniref:diguanylate cyclase n=1 Tax=Litchfieldella anticariensis (strain DSM 16096 / CECT 5854 / CIP 108499 / LMG 22089 / FP35) TaxID=1121939 RepID=S2KIQ3_LITA3|nr:diguanylate cyclase [Halomonas anticariensis]EPC02017.1 hypothetical protein L861_20405 [Halomonas anticariensis FP35 = DSM 16096]